MIIIIIIVWNLSYKTHSFGGTNYKITLFKNDWFENKINLDNLYLWLTGSMISEENMFTNDFNQYFNKYMFITI